MSYYEPKQLPSIPPSYASRSPGPTKMGGYPGGNQSTPYEQELDEITERTVPRPGQQGGYVDENRAWKTGADNFFQSPPSALQNAYKTFCCNSRGGLAAWIVGFILLIVGVIIALVLTLHQHDNSQPQPVGVASSSSTDLGSSTATITRTLTPSTIHDTKSISPLLPSTVTTVSVSTYLSSLPSIFTTTEVSTATTEREEVPTPTTLPASTVTVTSVVSGTAITETEIESVTIVSVSGSVSTEVSTVPTTIVTTVVSTQAAVTETETETETETKTTTSIGTTLTTVISSVIQVITSISGRIIADPNTVTATTTVLSPITTATLIP